MKSREIIVIEGKDNYSRIPALTNTVFFTHNKKYFEKVRVKCKKMLYQESFKIMGETTSNVVLDLNYSLEPDNLCRIAETVIGGGKVIFLVPDFDDWKNMETRLDKLYTALPFTKEDVKKNFISYFIRKLKEYKLTGIKEEKKEIKIPQEIKFPKKYYQMCLTQEQVDVLFELEDLKKAVIITANRGRGKSAVVGIALNCIEGKKKITSMHIDNSKVVRKFSGCEYIHPRQALNEKLDLLVVEEAASFPVSFLFEYLKNNKKVIYLTTTGGYEGAGRGFSLKFIKKLKEEKIDFLHLKIKEPIRYPENDSVEKWLYDVFLLDIEPKKIDKIDNVKFRELEREKLILDEKKLKDFFSIYVSAHYQNCPNDLFFMMDAPHVKLFSVESNDDVICAVQCLIEGNLENESVNYSGNLIPERVSKHYQNFLFQKLKGLRIQRIAVHPDFQGKGFGSLALNELKRQKFDYLGTSYGVSLDLINFWNKSGFFALHLSPVVNNSSGEFSVIEVLPLLENGIYKEINLQFRRKLIYSLSDIHRNLEPKIVCRLFDSPYEFKERVELSDKDKKRMDCYLEGLFTYESVIDLIKILVMNYFVCNKRVLEKNVEEILIFKVLQNNIWTELEKKFNTPYSKIFEIIREAVRRIGI